MREREREGGTDEADASPASGSRDGKAGT